MKVCLSFNGVIANTAAALVEQIKRDHGIVIPPAGFSKDSVGQLFPNVVPDGLPKTLQRSEYSLSKRNLFETEAFRHLRPIDGAVEGIRVLRAEGVEPIIVTDAKSVTRTRLETWLARRGLKDLEVIFTRKGRKDREPHQCKCQVVVDDNVERLLGLRDHPELMLVHFAPARGTAGSEASRLYLGTKKTAVSEETTGSEIISIRGWDELTSLLREHLEESSTRPKAA